jgi:protein SCO1/2
MKTSGKNFPLSMRFELGILGRALPWDRWRLACPAPYRASTESSRRDACGPWDEHVRHKGVLSDPREEHFRDKRVLSGSRGQHALRFHLKVLLLIFWLAIAVSSVPAQAPPGPSSPLYGARPETGPPATGLPAALQAVRIEQKLDQQLPLDLVFRDENGSDVKLGQYFGKKPVVLAFVYYDCPMLCTQVLNGMVTSFRVLPFQIGQEFDVVTISFDPRETPALAQSKKKVYVDYLPEKMRANAAAGWHFLTGDQANIEKITEAAGFHYRWDDKTQQFAHASAIMVTTPQGKLSRYFYGVDYPARYLRLGLIESAENRIGSPADQLLLYCYHYDPATGTYGARIMLLMRIAGVVTLLGIIAMVVLLKGRNTVGQAFLPVQTDALLPVQTEEMKDRQA